MASFGGCGPVAGLKGATKSAGNTGGDHPQGMRPASSWQTEPAPTAEVGWIARRNYLVDAPHAIEVMSEINDHRRQSE